MVRKSSRLSTVMLIGSIVLLVGSLVIIGLIARWYATGVQPPLVHYVLPDTEIDETDVPIEELENYQVPAEHPKYLAIPALDIAKSRVTSVGVDADNVIGSPVNIHDTAWYNQSATPGSGGTVLIDGHNGGYVRDGVFARLKELQAGDIIEVTRGDDQLFRYEVREVNNLPLAEANTSGMSDMMTSAQDGVEGLSLITCDGTYNAGFRQFDHRIMVRAVLSD